MRSTMRRRQVTRDKRPIRSATRDKTISQYASLPVIDDVDIAWVCDVLGFPSNAFTGSSGIDSRRSIMRSAESLDVEACPGSGKTTLLVAKLAILGRKWTANRSGLCVLSHTNVARREIETRLGNTAAGRSLLAYPHFIGTIHGFVNEFLALPWLRSLGYPIEMIDDEVSLRRRWQKLSFPTRRALEQNIHSRQILRVQDTSFGLGAVRWGKGGELG
ncbi:MAG: AAA family ATPase, partial [Gammaproteobacteria bacterium]|nr:AAA family ATPase [Gammaproteobacteria bacterium]